MDSETSNIIFGIAGILGLVVGIGSWIHNYIKDRKRLLYTIEYVCSIEKAINGFLTHLKIQYDGKELSDRLYVIEGNMENGGNRDIYVSGKQSEVVLSLNRKCEIVDCLLYPFDNTKVSHTIEDNKVHIFFDLLRKKRAIQFKILFKAEEAISESGGLTIADNNVPDLEITEKEALGNEMKRRSSYWSLFTLTFFALFSMVSVFENDESYLTKAGNLLIMVILYCLGFIAIRHPNILVFRHK